MVGCGVAGLASALALRRRGHEVVLFEAFEQPQPLGSGLLLQPSGLAAMRALGLDAIHDFGARIERLEGLDADGTALMAMRYAHWRPGAYGLGVHRATLFGLLFDAAMAAGAALRTGRPIVDIADPARPQLVDAHGERHGPFDLAVIADGSGSRLRNKVRPAARAPVYPWGAVWANAVDAEGRFAGALHQRYRGCSVMAGILPIGRGPGGRRDLVSLFWSLPQAEIDGFLADGLEDWRDQMRALWPEAEPVFGQIREASMFSRAIYRDVNVGRWSRGAVVLIGDAAHGTSPQLGQGANLALIDAVELALRVETPKRVAAYQRSRRRQTAPYQLMSRALTPLFQSRGGVWAIARRAVFAPLAQAPGLRRMSARVLTGVFRLGRTPEVLRP